MNALIIQKKLNENKQVPLTERDHSELPNRMDTISHDVHTENGNLKQMIQRLEETLEILKQQSRVLMETNEILKKNCEKLDLSNSALKASNEKLMNQNSDLQNALTAELFQIDAGKVQSC